MRKNCLYRLWILIILIIAVGISAIPAYADSLFGPVPPTNYCCVLGPVPYLDEYLPSFSDGDSVINGIRPVVPHENCECASSGSSGGGSSSSRSRSSRSSSVRSSSSRSSSISSSRSSRSRSSRSSSRSSSSISSRSSSDRSSRSSSSQSSDRSSSLRSSSSSSSSRSSLTSSSERSSSGGSSSSRSGSDSSGSGDSSDSGSSGGGSDGSSSDRSSQSDSSGGRSSSKASSYSYSWSFLSSQSSSSPKYIVFDYGSGSSSSGRGGTGDSSEWIFSDVDSSTREGEAILYLYRRGIIGGYPDGTFRGYMPISRADAAKILLRAAGYQLIYLKNNGMYPDLEDGSCDEIYLMNAVMYGLMEGYPDGTIRPNTTVNHAEFLKMVGNAFRLGRYMCYHYIDVHPLAWYTQYAGIAEKYDFFLYKQDYLTPGLPMIRREAAWALYQVLMFAEECKVDGGCEC